MLVKGRGHGAFPEPSTCHVCGYFNGNQAGGAALQLLIGLLLELQLDLLGWTGSGSGSRSLQPNSQVGINGLWICLSECLSHFWKRGGGSQKPVGSEQTLLIGAQR